MINIAETGQSQGDIFTPAMDRPYIPREGFYSGAKYQLSVAPHPDLAMPSLDYIPLENAAYTLKELWNALQDQRLFEENNMGVPESHPAKYGWIPGSVFAPTTESLFRNAIAPAVQQHCQKVGKDQVAVDLVSYLLPFWTRDQLVPAVLVEGELSRLIKEGGKLPDTIGAVYIDFPPNQQNKENDFDIDQLVSFIKKHPSVFFVVDQANLYFAKWNNENDLLYYVPEDKTKRLTDDDLVIVTNTTTKSFGKSGCAIAMATLRAKEVMASTLDANLPTALGFDEDSFMWARQSLNLEVQSPELRPTVISGGDYHELTAYKFRQVIAENKKTLYAKLNELFGEDASAPKLAVEGARMIINANELGFGSAQEMCDTLVRDYSIATKPASVYASPKKEKEWSKYVQMTISWNDEMMGAVLEALEQLHARKSIKT